MKHDAFLLVEHVMIQHKLNVLFYPWEELSLWPSFRVPAVQESLSPLGVV